MKIWNRNTIDLEKFKNENITIHCDTEEKANDLLKYLDEQGITWKSNLKLIENTYYDIHRKLTCYYLEEFGRLSFSTMDWYMNAKYEIIEWEIVNKNSEVENMKCNINNFDIERFKTGNYAIHCNTEEKAKELLDYLDKEYCMTWGLGTNIEDTGWKTFRGKTCYSYNTSNGTLGFCNYQYYKENGIIIYEFESQYPLAWRDFISGEFAIHCKRESEVNELLQWIYKFNTKNEIVNSPLAILGEGLGTEREDICYYVYYGYIKYCEKSYCNGTILEWNNKYEYQQKNNIRKNNITWDAFMIEDIVIHCKTEKETEELLCWILQNKKEMLKSPISSFADGWYSYKGDVCFEFDLEDSMICYGNKKFYNSKSYKILEWSGKKLYEVNGTIETELSEDEFNDKFIEFIESINAEFGGGIKPC